MNKYKYSVKNLKVGDWIDSTDYWNMRYLYKVLFIKKKIYMTLNCYIIRNNSPENLGITKHRINYFDENQFKVIDESEAFQWFI